MNMTLATKNKYLLLAIAFVVIAFGAFHLNRDSGQASAESMTDEPPLAVLEPASTNTIEEQPPAVQKQLAFAASGVAARSPEEPVEVESMGESSVPGEGSVEVAEVGEEICAFQTGEIGNCAEESEITRGRIFTATPIGCGAYEVLGIVDDEVASLRVTPEQGSSYELDVHENIYLDSFAALATMIEGLDASGDVVFVNWLPLDEYREQNDACSSGSGEAAAG